MVPDYIRSNCFTHRRTRLCSPTVTWWYYKNTILKTNLEALKEFAFQLRLRNIGGLIIIDFIDMSEESHRQQVLRTLEKALERDTVRTSVSGISPLGLVEMTRKRVRESIGRTLCEPCPYCEGKGYVKGALTVIYEILRELQRELADGCDTVTEGRDQGTLAFPAAECKIFLTASPAERAHRRLSSSNVSYTEMLSRRGYPAVPTNGCRFRSTGRSSHIRHTANGRVRLRPATLRLHAESARSGERPAIACRPAPW